jgi:hypothetical protein
MKNVLQALDLTARNWLPRLLTQVCRDPSSPLWGSFDRDWWHYRIRDFSSIILQQGGYAVYLASQLAENASQREALCQLAAASARFWNQRALQWGAFEEYYPWEQGYPPLAFSTLAVMKLATAGVVSPDSIRPGAAMAANQLQSRFESQAANQQVAGLAALAWCRKVFTNLVSESGFESLTRQTLALQTREGWYEEYGGPDLGYLSVTVDCLWDLFDATGDPRFSASIEQATDCIRRFVSLIPTGSIGMHNARNTDYLVPYGLVRLALQKPTPENLSLVIRLFGGTEKPAHFFNAVDDRYVSHYIGQSLFRAILLLEQAANLPVAEEAAASPGPALEVVTESGHFLRRTREGASSLVTLRKGGIFSHHADGRSVHDFGWLVRAGGRLYFSHWWSNDWRHGREGTQLWVAGPLYEQREMASTPARHMALRMASLAAGRRLIGLLKKRLIFKKTPCLIQFQRMIEWHGVGVRVVDTFSSLPAGSEFIPAPRSSKRHVASADSFHREDLQLLNGFKCSREFHPSTQGMEIVTTYLPLDILKT